MYARKMSVNLRLSPRDADFIYYELLALVDHYGPDGDGCKLELADESALLLTIGQLGVGLARAKAVGSLQLEQFEKQVDRLRNARSVFEANLASSD